MRRQIYKEILKKVNAMDGWHYFYTSSGHLRVCDKSGPIATASKTPSDARSHKNFIAQLRRAGLEI